MIERREPTMPQLPADHETRMERARLALDGLSVGDALGASVFNRVLSVTVQNLVTPRSPGWSDRAGAGEPAGSGCRPAEAGGQAGGE
jgi:hypothetical protein